MRLNFKLYRLELSNHQPKNLLVLTVFLWGGGHEIHRLGALCSGRIPVWCLVVGRKAAGRAGRGAEPREPASLRLPCLYTNNVNGIRH